MFPSPVRLYRTLFAFVVLLLCAADAHAAPYCPPFDKDQTVYLAPRATSKVLLSFESKSLHATTLSQDHESTPAWLLPLATAGLIVGLLITGLILATNDSYSDREAVRLKIKELTDRLSTAQRALEAIPLVADNEAVQYKGKTAYEISRLKLLVNHFQTAEAVLLYLLETARSHLSSHWGAKRAMKALTEPAYIPPALHKTGTKFLYHRLYTVDELLAGLDSVSEIACFSNILSEKIAGARAQVKLKDRRLEAKAAYLKLDLPFDPFLNREKETEEQFMLFEKEVATDPLGAVEIHAALFHQINRQIDQFNTGITLYFLIPEVADKVRQLKDKTAAASTASVSLEYPGSTGSEPGERRFDLVSEANPAQKIVEAERQLSLASEALKRGSPFEADYSCLAAIEAHTAGSQILQEILSAPATVVQAVRDLQIENEKLTATEESARIAFAGAQQAHAGDTEDLSQLEELFIDGQNLRASVVVALRDCQRSYEQGLFLAAKQASLRAVRAVQQSQATFSQVMEHIENLDQLRLRATLALAGLETLLAELCKEPPVGSSADTLALRKTALELSLSLQSLVRSRPVRWVQAATTAAAIDAALVKLGEAVKTDKAAYDAAIAKIQRAKARRCPQSKCDQAYSAANSGDSVAVDAAIAGYVAASGSCGSSSSCSSCSSSSSGSSCGGSSCGGGGCGGV